MITKIILVIFAIIYYLFSIFLFATYIQDVRKRYTAFQILGILLETMIIAPIAVPIMLGIEIGEYLGNN